MECCSVSTDGDYSSVNNKCHRELFLWMSLQVHSRKCESHQWHNNKAGQRKHCVKERCKIYIYKKKNRARIMQIKQSHYVSLEIRRTQKHGHLKRFHTVNFKFWLGVKQKNHHTSIKNNTRRSFTDKALVNNNKTDFWYTDKNYDYVGSQQTFSVIYSHATILRPFSHLPKAQKFHKHSVL